MNIIKKTLIVFAVISSVSLNSIQVVHADAVSLAVLLKELNAIESHQKVGNKELEKANSALNSGFPPDALKSFENLSPEPSLSKFSEYMQDIAHSGSKSKENNSVKAQIKNLPDNKYLMSLVQGQYYDKEVKENLLSAGASPQAVVLATAVLSQVNLNEKTNGQLLKAVQAQLSKNWQDGLRVSTRDQLLRMISLQLSVSNLSQYQQLRTQELMALLQLAGLMDHGVLLGKLTEINNKSIRIDKKLSEVNRQLDIINRHFKKSSN
ncbi:hypothetical protein PsalN5692_02037 [Piscirickettsia salmonis]|uniref:hypothetical protein n=1 Tax=Piscirickettsia salmonis TaxID=1238 RepID=UPI0012B8BCEF|nr:hypothetical protein [Piscirickettsia salmonis]QGP50572.1 hypothetical protein PsalN5692_02037 [Piscirickettsia salmonis]QGP54221.1 hypothetical protein PsalSR1_01653 [Piscirickettsia salmonis]QGP59880.1 hypothetical protein PsalBI1_02477 [Piscirickettsia salmonis]QGP63798.1 hypothetical protein PsalMR5_01662 [Piscirickettsia salmonis]